MISKQEGTQEIIEVANPNERQQQISQCSKIANTTLEHQMQIVTDYSIPKGEPQLVGLTTISYSPSDLQISQSTISPIQNYKQQKDIDLEDRILKGESSLNEISSDENEDLRILTSLPNNNHLFSKHLQLIEIVGFNMTKVPAITNLTYFMNQSFYLQSKFKDSEANQVDFMTTQLLVTTKRATQAAELLRKMQMRELNGIDKFTKLVQNKKFVQCAVWELMIADSFSSYSQINQKMQSLLRLQLFLKKQTPKDINQRFCGQQEIQNYDSFSQILVYLPELLRFSIVCLAHKLEIIKICALKMIKYILETLGCSLDQGMVFILKAMFNTYPNGQQKSSEDFDFISLIGQDITITEYLFGQKENRQKINASKFTQIMEPQSGSKKALMNIYTNVLETYISVLSSVSSHILHAIFYDVIQQETLTSNSNYPVEVRIFTCKIADKIFSICQGDLILSPRLLDTLLTLSSIKPILNDQIENIAQQQLKNLWTSIKQKVLPNYSNKGFQSIVKWLVQNLTVIQQSDGQDDRVRQMAEIITIITLGRQKNDEDANQLIKLTTYDKYGGGATTELYLVLAPLLYWLEYSIDQEERFPLFVQLYQTVKDILQGLPIGQQDLDIVSVIFPSLQRASEFMVDNSPSPTMIKFLDLVLTDMIRHYQKNQRTQPPLDIQYFFSDMLSNLVVYISYSPNEEILFVFEKLISLCSDVMTDKVLKSCILSLIDKFSVKSKQFKSTVTSFIKFLLNPNNCSLQNQESANSNQVLEEMLSEGGLDHNTRPNYFEVMSEFCFFNNQLSGQHQESQQWKLLEFRNKQDIQDLNLEKLEFFIECLSCMNEAHIIVFTNLITHPQFRNNLLILLEDSNSRVRLKSHDILEALTQYFVQYCPSKTVYEFTNGTNQTDTLEAEFISHERLYISQIVIQIVKVSLQKSQDCYLQFNSLILLDFLFQNLLPVPTFQNELMKSKRNQRQTNEENLDDDIMLDVEFLSISESTPELDVMEPTYLKMRMKLVVSMWPYVETALNSPWSNIRSICYGLICSMLRIDVNDYQSESQEVNTQSLQQLILPMLFSLLSSKESESKAGGLNILGSFCGLSYDFNSVRVNKYLSFFQRNTNFISYSIWNLVWDLQDDWDITIKEASVVLIQLCAPRNAIYYFESLKEKQEKQRLDYLTKMKKISNAYTENFTSYIVNDKKQLQTKNDSQLHSKHAKRTVELFPTTQDCNEILHLDQKDDSISGLSFQQFMFGKQTQFKIDSPKASQIISSGQDLAELIHKFNPEFQDNRLTGQNQQMTRRRQMEIELGMTSNHAKQDQKFFVDGYKDEQIQEIISIFRNDFKPPKNLWIEKQASHNQISTNYHGQPPQSQSPDFYQDIYSEAIEQFNQHQMMMQQKQQDELQQQVSTGSQQTNIDLDGKHNNSQGSSTPSPQIKEDKSEEKSSTQLNPISGTVVTNNWPTSPVLVSYKDKKKTLSENINLEQKEKKSEEDEKKQEVRNKKKDSRNNSEENLDKFSPENKKEDKKTKISRKTAQTYLSNLNQGYLKNFDNVKLFNNCLSQNSGLSVEQGTEVKETKVQKNKKTTISNSPDHQKKPNKNSKKIEKQFKSNPGKLKTSHNLADLNYFIKSLEKGITVTTTPSNIIKKVESQIRALGVDPKLLKQVEQIKKNERNIRPELKLLSLNKIVGKDESLTPSNSIMSPKQPQNDNESTLKKRLDKTKNRDSESRDEQSSGRGNANSFTLLNSPAILTERNSQNYMFLKKEEPGKVPNSTRYDSTGIFQFKKGHSKSQSKGYSAFASKSMVSPNLNKEMAPIVIGKLNQSQMISSQFRKKKEVKQQEQGSDKRIMSPESGKGKQKKKRNSSNIVTKPGLVLQQPSYY